MTYADRIPLTRPAATFAEARAAGIWAPAADTRPCGHTPAQHRHDDGQAADTRTQDRAVRELTAERDAAWQNLAAVERERAELLGTITAAWAALNAAGLQSPTASVADLIGKLAAQRDLARTARYGMQQAWEGLATKLDAARAERDEARADRAKLTRATAALLVDCDELRQLAAMRAGVIDRHAAELAAAGRTIARLRALQEDTDRVLAAYATVTPEPDDDDQDEYDAADVAEVLERGETVRVDSRDVVWRPTEGGQWQHPIYGLRADDELEDEFGPTRLALLLATDDEQDQGDDGTPGSDQARAQDQPDPADLATRWIDAAGIPVIGRDVRAWLDQLGVPVPVGIWPLMAEIRRAVIAAGDAGYDAGRRAQGLRLATWEQQAVDAVRDAVADAWPHLGASVVAEVAVRAIIDANLAGAGGRCPSCGATYLRTMPAGADQRCWTCSTADQTGGLDEPAATLAQIAAEAAQHQAAALADMSPAYPASNPANTREG
ncbi:hypothetical protein [Micromonospora sp. NPDC001898]|uniref:hypothetical protein n=1 Tax=Micromonospora sp. NPDC001898 TaxID=3364221 RepID=UPI0036C02741